MNKTQLLADLLTVYKAIGTAVDQGTQCSGIHQYNIPVFEIGLSEANKKPTGQQKTISFFVYNEGLGDEAAYYQKTEPVNTVNKDVTIGTSSYAAIAKLYNSVELQARVLSAVITQCSVVFQESPSTTNHANRMKLVSAANVDLDNIVKRFMSAIALNAVVQAAGTAVADSVLLAIVSGAWDPYASLIVA